MSTINNNIQLELPEVHNTKDVYLRCRTTRKEIEEYKALALKAGYVSTSDLVRAGLILVKERVEAREIQQQ